MGWYRRLQIAHVNEGFPVSLFAAFAGLLPEALIRPLSQGSPRATIGPRSAPLIGITLKGWSWILLQIGSIFPTIWTHPRFSNGSQDGICGFHGPGYKREPMGQSQYIMRVALTLIRTQGLR